MISSPALADAIKSVRACVDGETLARLAVPDAKRIARDLATDWGIILAAFAVAGVFPFLWTWCVAFVAIGMCQYRLFVLGHEALHACLHRDRATNDRLARWLVYGPMWTGFADSRRAHVAHHDRLGAHDDPERYIYEIGNKNSKWRLLLLCLGVLTFFRAVQRVVPYREIGSTTSAGKALRQRASVLVAQVAIVLLLWFFGLPWWSYVVLWLAPIYVFVFVPDEIRSFCDHAVLAAPDEAGDRQRLITYLPGRFEALLLAPHNLHYQAEHHAFPELPYHALPEVHRLVGDHPEITVRRSYFGFLWQAFTAVPLQPRAA